MPEPEPELPGGDQEIVCPGRAGVGTVTRQMITSVKKEWDIGRKPRGPAVEHQPLLSRLLHCDCTCTSNTDTALHRVF
jgi:hypothetical protein